MQVLLLGNGFDLYYKLPTRYINFLNTINYLINNSFKDVKTVGDIFGSKKLHAADKHIAESYMEYKELYDTSMLPMEVIEKFATMAETNVWYSFLWHSFNKDIGWIDFENQINLVIQAFKNFLEDCPSPFSILTHPKQPLARYIIKQFDYFLENEQGSVYSIKDEYMLEDPIGSRIYKMNMEKWIGFLKADLDEFTEMLRLYLYHFVEQPILNMPPSLMEHEWFVKLQPEFVVTFNYTSTFEHFCKSAKVAHIHGRVSEKIVLGVNPNEDDDVNTTDTTFIEFKKYHQRIILGTDTEYRITLAAIEDLGEESISLTVMGHSLDITDEDVIRELFDNASDIAILYHCPTALRDYIAKLIVLYGKDEFDAMRREKNLRFISIEENIDSHIEDATYRESLHLYVR